LSRNKKEVPTKYLFYFVFVFFINCSSNCMYKQMHYFDLFWGKRMNFDWIFCCCAKNILINIFMQPRKAPCYLIYTPVKTLAFKINSTSLFPFPYKTAAPYIIHDRTTSSLTNLHFNWATIIKLGVCKP